jgi:hypothetical protein
MTPQPENIRDGIIRIFMRMRQALTLHEFVKDSGMESFGYIAYFIDRHFPPISIIIKHKAAGWQSLLVLNQ